MKEGSIIYRLTRAALRNVTFIVILVFIGLAGGIWSLLQMPMESFPSISAPIVNIVTQYPSAPPQTVATQVTTPVANALVGLAHINTVNSTSSEGYSVVTAEFNVGASTQETVNEVTQALQGLTLPSGATTPAISTVSFGALPIVRLALSGASLAELGHLANHLIQPSLTSVPGVSSVTVNGAASRDIQISLNPAAMADHHINASEVSSAIQDALKSFPLGQTTVAGKGVAVVAQSMANSADTLKTLPLTSSTASPSSSQAFPGGHPSVAGLKVSPVTLGQVATVTEALSPADTISRLNGRPSVTLNVIETTNANTVTVANGVMKQIAALNNQLPHGVHFQVLENQATSVTQSVDGMAREALLGAVLAVIVIAFFLGNGRSTLVAVVAIPLSILISMIVLNAMGITLNMMTLGGMAVAVGRVVDDSIVMLESVYRRIQTTGKRGTDTIVHGAKEVASAITASTLTTIGVFFPIALVSGIVGEFFRPFAYTVVFSLIASWFVALMVNPILIHLFLRKGHIETRSEWRPAATYRRILQWSLSHQGLVLGTAGVLLLGSLALVPSIGTSFLPITAAPSLDATMQLPAGTTLAATNQDSLAVEHVIRQLPGVTQYQTTVGGGGSAFNPVVKTNTASFYVSLSSSANPQALATTLANRLNALHIAQATFSVTPGSSFQGGSSTNQAQVLVQSNNPVHLAQASRTVAHLMQEQGVTQVTNQLSTSQPEVEIAVNAQNASHYGLNATDIIGQLEPYLNNQDVGNIPANSASSAPTPVYLQLKSSSATSLAGLQQLPIETLTGTTIPLDKVAAVTMQNVQTTITETNNIPTATVSGVITSSNVGKVTRDIRQAIQAAHLPSDVSIVMGGVSQMQSQAFSQLGEAIVTAIVLVYLIMVLAFGEGRAPLAILFSLPLAVIGALLGLFITHQSLGIPALIGFLMLIGIVVTNAIVLVDLIQQHRRNGMALNDAIVQAGSTRLRPILMTALATIGALLPLALGANDSSIISASLAVVVIGGLLTSTLLTLVVVPIMYRILHRKKDQQHHAVERLA